MRLKVDPACDGVSVVDRQVVPSTPTLVQRPTVTRPDVVLYHCGHRNRTTRASAPSVVLHCRDPTLSLSAVEPDDEGHDEFPFPHDELGPGQGLLLVKRGPNARSTFLLEDGVTPWVAIETAVFLDDITVSRNTRRSNDVRARSGSSATSAASTAYVTNRSTRPSSQPVTRSRSAGSS